MEKILKELKEIIDTGILPNGDHIDVTSKIYIEELYAKLSGRVEAEVVQKTAKKYFLDTEFIEQPNTIDLISIGIVCEDGRKYYAISNQFDEAKANDWVLENVIYKLESLPRKTLVQIKAELLEFITGENIEFWGYYSDYDWVVFCWIFGTMIELPNGYPMYCRDIKQLLEESGKDKIAEPVGEHNALADAEWNLKLYKHLTDSRLST
jgi:hypothetical protein